MGLSLRETVLVIFGSPAAGTPVMAAAPLAALDLPLKVLVWADEGQTKVSYYARRRSPPATISVPDLARNLAGIDALTDALVGSVTSHRTVAAHLYQAFPKLGVTSRAALRDALPPPPDPEPRSAS